MNRKQLPEGFTEETKNLIDDIGEAISKNVGAHGGAVIAALSSITATAIRLYSAEKTDAGRAATLDAFIGAVKDCLAQELAKKGERL